MSRIGKKPIELPEKVEVKIEGSDLTVKGPKGELRLRIHPAVKISREANLILVNVGDENDAKQRALWGLTRTLAANMIEGVTKGFEKKLEINGIGYKAGVNGQKLILNVGYSHPVEFVVPAGVTVKVEANVITVAGIEKRLVGEIAAQIRAIKKPEPYKGKGIKYLDEQVRRKAGKAAKAVGS